MKPGGKRCWTGWSLRPRAGTARIIAALGTLALLAGPAVSLAEPPVARQRKSNAAPRTPPRDSTLTCQAALDRAGFSPGLLDGKGGRKTTLALKAFQAAHGLPQTAAFDKATRAALRVDDEPPTARYTITAADLRGVGPVPRNWKAKARLDRLQYPSLTELLAERGHCTRALLTRLNPGRALDRLRAGDRVVLPNVTAQSLPPAAALEVDLDAKVVRARDKAGRTLALFHCSIARFAEKRPRGSAKVTSVAFDPVYMFDPRMWPEVRDVKQRLRIPPGPRNPVGVCWIDLSLPGYGIHGTPNPELIGKTGSHGCIRLANWDARRLGRMVRAGLPVHFVER